MTTAHSNRAHPLADFRYDDATFSETRARVVGLSEARAGLLRKLTERSKRLVLVTDERSSLTPPLRDALLGAGGMWVVREAPRGKARDASTGRGVDRLAEITYPPGPLTLGTTSRIFLGETPDGTDPVVVREIERRRAAPAARLITLSLSVRHSARRTTVLGRTAELAVETLTGAPPTSWGRHEPALVPWDRTALTADARKRIPEPARLVVVGRGAIGTVLVRRTKDGLEETTTLELAAGPSGSAAARDAVDRVAGLFDTLAEETVPLFFLATTRTGRADLLVPSELQAPPVPLAMLLGPPGVRRLKVDLDEAARRFDAVRVGKRRLPGLRFPLGTFDHADWGTTSEVVRWLEADDVLAALGNPPSLSEPPRIPLREVATDGA